MLVVLEQVLWLSFHIQQQCLLSTCPRVVYIRSQLYHHALFTSILTFMNQKLFHIFFDQYILSFLQFNYTCTPMYRVTRFWKTSRDSSVGEDRDFKYCQAQPKLQVKLSLMAELALISINPAPNGRRPLDYLQMEDDLNFLVNGRQSKLPL